MARQRNYAAEYQARKARESKVRNGSIGGVQSTDRRTLRTQVGRAIAAGQSVSVSAHGRYRFVTVKPSTLARAGGRQAVIAGIPIGEKEKPNRGVKAPSLFRGGAGAWVDRIDLQNLSDGIALHGSSWLDWLARLEEEGSR